MIFQHFNLLEMRNVYENVAFPLELMTLPKQEIHERVLDLLDIVELNSKRLFYPAQLSGGQKQRVSIARALAMHPKVLLCDEATSSLDTESEHQVQKALDRLMKGRTSFDIAHRLSTIRDADKVIVIKDGQIVEQGTHQQLLDAKGFFHQLYMSQFKGLAI